MQQAEKHRWQDTITLVKAPSTSALERLLQCLQFGLVLTHGTAAKSLRPPPRACDSRLLKVVQARPEPVRPSRKRSLSWQSSS